MSNEQKPKRKLEFINYSTEITVEDMIKSIEDKKGVLVSLEELIQLLDSVKEETGMYKKLRKAPILINRDNSIEQEALSALKDGEQLAFDVKSKEVIVVLPLQDKVSAFYSIPIPTMPECCQGKDDLEGYSVAIGTVKTDGVGLIVECNKCNKKYAITATVSAVVEINEKANDASIAVVDTNG